MTSPCLQLRDHDVFFISYDEANCEENWKDLKEKWPDAQRVHGVKGFDSAHKKAASLSKTQRFITIDGDNIIYPEFFQQDFGIELHHFKPFVFSWASKNMTNGLIYGNGGIKSWDKDTCLSMNTHENSKDKRGAVDFCYDLIYLQINDQFSETHIDKTPLQSFRAGLREGVKMPLINGELSPSANGQVPQKPLKQHMHDKNYDRLCVWMSVGSDVKNGDWAILGARYGVYSLFVQKRPIEWIRDYDSILEEWDLFKYKDPREEMKKYEQVLKHYLGFDITYFEPEQSKFWKSIYKSPPRVDKYINPWEGVKIQIKEWHKIPFSKELFQWE